MLSTNLPAGIMVNLKNKAMENKHKQFKPFDKVLVRGHNPIWKPDLYAYWNESIDAHQVIGFGNVSDGYILPYEGNEELVGTTDEPEEEIELKEGEWLMVSNGIHNHPSKWELRECMPYQSSLMVKNPDSIYTHGLYKYAVRFSDFNPNDMEETKKHILCVKNGKIIRYKG